jgi:hypothetical protein
MFNIGTLSCFRAVGGPADHGITDITGRRNVREHYSSYRPS